MHAEIAGLAIVINRREGSIETYLLIRGST